VGADPEDDQPLGFGRALGVVLRIAEAGEVDGGLAVDFFLCPAVHFLHQFRP
jgi:hypothetical protein